MKPLTLFLIVLNCLNLNAQITIKETEIDKGVHHKKIINTIDTLVINVLRIDLSGSDYFLQAVKAQDILNAKQTTSEMARNNNSDNNIIAAINADFFEADGEVVNNMISEGDYVKAVKFTDSPFNKFVNTQFAVTSDNKLLMDQFVFTGTLVLPDGSTEEIKRINSKADSNSISLYNYYQGNFTPETPDSWYKIEYVLKPVNTNDSLKFVVAKIIKNMSTEIIKDNFILSSNNGYAYYLERELSESDTISLQLKLNPHYGEIRSLIGGWPRIVADGKNVIKTNKNVEGVFTEFSEARHPRTGIGFSRDSSSVYFVTVDGRQSISRGMSLDEFADLMISEGIYHGLNLDGGGSTTMIINNKVVNNPSDSTGERKVGNCLILIKK